MAKLIRKSAFKTKENVCFDGFEKTGTIIAISKDKLKIFSNKEVVFRHPQTVYKLSEMIGSTHWDTLKKTEKVKILNKHKVSKDLARRDWHDIPSAIKSAIYKDEGSDSPTGINTDTLNVFNPVTSDKTVTERIQEELSEQSKDKDDDSTEKSKEESVEKSESPTENLINSF